MAWNMELYDDCGYLEIIKGSMYSGKTNHLMNINKKYTFCNIPTMVVNYTKDERYSDTMLSSHDKIMIPCLKALKLKELVAFEKNTGEIIGGTAVDDFLKAKAILINEGQFFQDIVEWGTLAVEKYHKNVYICGLNSDYKRNKFGDWLDLEAICDNVVMLHSFCSHCKKRPGIFSHRLSQEEEIEVIGSDCYIPVCRKCYTILYTKNKTYIKTI